MTFERGQIYRVNLEPIKDSEQRDHAKPCVVLTVTAFNQRLHTVGVVPLTSSPRSLPPLVVSVPSAGKPQSMALCHQIRTIDKCRIGKLIGRISPEDLKKIETAIRTVHGL